MLFFALFLFSISKASKPSDNALVTAVEDTMEDCSDMLQAIWDSIAEIKDVDVCRPVEEVGDKLTNQVESKLVACRTLVGAVTFFRTKYIRSNFGEIDLKKSEWDYVNSLLKPVSKKMGDVLYVASRDGDAASRFHSACDNQGPTVVIVETTTGAVFGGYTDIGWTKSTGHKPSTNSFLFRLQPSMKQYKIKSAETAKAVYHHANYGPTFGAGHDFFIKDFPFSNKLSYTKGGNTYIFPKYPSYELTNGTDFFQVKDYLVFKAISL